MTSDNPKKPPPPPPKLASKTPTQIPPVPVPAPVPSEIPLIADFGEEAQDNSGSKADHTIATIVREHTITRLPGRIVPVIQVSAGAEQGRILSLAQYKQVLIGRQKQCELYVYDPSCSRQHAEIKVQGDGRVMIKDLNSTNGTKVNSTKLKSGEEMELTDGDRVQLGDNTVLRFSLIPEDVARAQMEVYQRATRDALTNAFNRHQFDEALDREISYQKRAEHGLAIILFDVDHFKKVNDTYGHPVGDEVLREIGQRVPSVIRNEDVFARIGGEEFAVLVRNDSIQGLQILAERIRQIMEKRPVEFESKSILFTVSVGCAYTTGKNSVTPAAFVAMADQALYEAKNTGRNRTVTKTAT